MELNNWWVVTSDVSFSDVRVIVVKMSDLGLILTES